MSLNQLQIQGAIYNGYPGNNAGGKAYANDSVNNLQVQGFFQQNLVPVAVNASANITPAEVLGGLITSVNTGAQTLTFPSGFALALLTLLGGAVSGGAVSNNVVLVNQTLKLKIVNAGSGAITIASADANTVIFDTANVTIASHAVRTLDLDFTALVNPTLTVY